LSIAQARLGEARVLLPWERGNEGRQGADHGLGFPEVMDGYLLSFACSDERIEEEDKNRNGEMIGE
jgi:hypothetical protein